MYLSRECLHTCSYLFVPLRSREKVAKREKQIEALEGMLSMAQLDFATLLHQKDELTRKLKEVKAQLSEAKSDFEHTVMIPYPSSLRSLPPSPYSFPCRAKSLFLSLDLSPAHKRPDQNLKPKSETMIPKS